MGRGIVFLSFVQIYLMQRILNFQANEFDAQKYIFVTQD